MSTPAAAVEGVDLDALREWMDDQGLGDGPISDIEPITGGTQNVLVRLSRGGRRYVLRRPPVHKRTNSDETMRREARVLAALAGSEVPHPALVAAERDTAVLGAAFYLMEPVDGFNPSLGLPEPHRSDPLVRSQMGLALVDAAAALGRVDHEAVGLGDLGHVDGYLERQVARWRSQLDGYAEVAPSWTPDIPRVDDVGEWLDAERPATFQPGIIHGDLHTANVLYRHDGPELAAIVDWELATIGDPLVDLGLTVAFRTVDPDGGLGPGGDLYPDFPQVGELVARYGEGSDRDTSAYRWYAVLACYKTGIILEGTRARAMAGKAPTVVGDQLHAVTLSLFRRAQVLIGEA